MSTESSGGDSTVKVRIMAESSEVEGLADSIISLLGEADGLTLVDRSRPCPCHAPEQEKP